METKVTLRKFIEIAPDVIRPWICEVHIDEYMAEYKDVMSRPIQFYKDSEFNKYVIRDMKNLEPYLDYEIYGFDQEYSFGQLDRQVIWIK